MRNPGLVQKATILAIGAGGSAVSGLADFFVFCMPAEPGCRIQPVFGELCAVNPARGGGGPVESSDDHVVGDDL